MYKLYYIVYVCKYHSNSGIIIKRVNLKEIYIYTYNVLSPRAGTIKIGNLLNEFTDFDMKYLVV